MSKCSHACDSDSHADVYHCNTALPSQHRVHRCASTRPHTSTNHRGSSMCASRRHRQLRVHTRTISDRGTNTHANANPTRNPERCPTNPNSNANSYRSDSDKRARTDGN